VNALSATTPSNLLLLKHPDLIASVQKANTVKTKDLASPALKTALPANKTTMDLAALNAYSPALLPNTQIFTQIKHVVAIHKNKLLLLLVVFHS
jgi:hypothetical protein